MLVKGSVILKRKFYFADQSAMPYTAWYDEPVFCPHCGRSEKPAICFTYPETDSNYAEYSQSELVELYRCTYDDCQKYFIVAYRYESSDSEGYHFSPIIYSYSGKHSDINFPEGIDLISPTFVEIFEQAAQAETYGLDQISGVGYRKALEFLIKDYAIQNSPENASTIRSQFLGKVISESLSSFPLIQSLAKAANWIGTDQTHYEQRYSSTDLNSMKQFIYSAATFISAEYLAKKAQAFVDANDPKRQGVDGK